MEEFLFDPHTHTAETSKMRPSASGRSGGPLCTPRFFGLVVTDPPASGIPLRIDTDHDWNAVCDHYLSGYHASKKRGDEVGFQVLLGAELRFPENDNDYLVYGIDENWLRSNPYICCMSAQEFFDKYHNQVLIIHAHPFRKGSAPVQETAVHGAEIINGNPRHENNNDLALALCRRHPEYYRLAGSDTHRAGGRGTGPASFCGKAQGLICLQASDRNPAVPSLEPVIPVLCGRG